jgi:hypothetical protein
MVRSVALVVLSAAGCAFAGDSWFDVWDGVFDAGMPGEVSGAGAIEGVPSGLDGVGHAGNQFSGGLLRNSSIGNPAASTFITISNLPDHEMLRLGFLFVFVDSWDSTDGSVTPDYFNLRIDGVSVLQITANNTSGSVVYGGDLLFSGHAGWNGGFIEKAYDMSAEAALQSIPHSGDSVTIEMFASGAGWQGGDDESWAIDNFRLGVLIPAPAVGFPIAIGIAGGTRRRRG